MIEKYKAELQKATGKRDLLQKQLAEFVTTRDICTERAKYIQEAQVLIQQVAINMQAQVIVKIDAIVNKVLSTVFPAYSFKLEYDVQRNKSVAQLKFFKGENEVKIVESDGGGVVDCACIALRLALWSLSNSRNVLILDEMGKFVSADMQPRLAEVMTELSHKLGIQILMVSHMPPMADYADKVFTISQDKLTMQSKVS